MNIIYINILHNIAYCFINIILQFTKFVNWGQISALHLRIRRILPWFVQLQYSCTCCMACCLRGSMSTESENLVWLEVHTAAALLALLEPCQQPPRVAREDSGTTVCATLAEQKTEQHHSTNSAWQTMQYILSKQYFHIAISILATTDFMKKITATGCQETCTNIF